MTPSCQAHHRQATELLYDPIFLKHDQPGHPEHAGRLRAMLTELETAGLLTVLRRIPCRAATLDELTAAHPLAYVKSIDEACQAGERDLNADTYMTRDTYHVARMAVGGLIDLTLAVIDGQIENGFACVRPPGHHALPNRAMGFCIFANVALAAKAAQQQRGIERIAIVDFDVHHGNGTQAIFEEDPTVLFISTHQHPLFPGTGSLREIGRNAGAGTTINLPLPIHVGDQGFRALYTDVLLPALRRFAPQLMLVSAGYDCHWNDPLASLGLSLTGLAWMSQTLAQAAQEFCGGKIVFTLEGGYDLNALSVGVTNSIKALLGRGDFSDPLGAFTGREPDLTEYINHVKQIHHK